MKGLFDPATVLPTTCFLGSGTRTNLVGATELDGTDGGLYHELNVYIGCLACQGFASV